MIRRFSSVAIVCAASLACCAQPCVAQCMYEMQVIASKPLPWPYDGLWDSVVPYAMNSCHTVVGTVKSYLDDDVDLQGFVWHPGDVYVTPVEPPVGATWTSFSDINDLNQVVGEFRIGNPEYKFAFVQDLDTGDLTIIPPPYSTDQGFYAIATSINNQGQVVGYWGNTWIGNPVFASFLWQDGVFQDLNPIFQTSESQALAINEAGVVGGWLVDSSLQKHAFRYDTATGGLIVYGAIPNGSTSTARAITESGDFLAGDGTGLPEQPALWPRAVLAVDGLSIDLGSLPDRPISTAFAVDDLGRVGGGAKSTLPSYGDRAFLWQAGSMHDLNILLLPDPLLTAAHWVAALNDDGAILGKGVWSGGLAGVAVRGFLASPTGSKPGDANFDCQVNAADLVLVLQSWGTSSPIGDVDHDGTVGGADLGLVLANWGQ
ncbi:MAG: DUF3466 family protein [Phycisphaerales bacterium]